jgi:hypothetical protein
MDNPYDGRKPKSVPERAEGRDRNYDYIKSELRRLIDEHGLTFASCVEMRRSETPDELAYVKEATLYYHRPGSVEVDPHAVVSAGDGMGASPGSRTFGAYVMAWVWVDDVSIWAGEVDSDGAPCRFVNHYHCDACDTNWHDQWSCACNDRCPECDREIEPYASDELDLDGSLRSA